MSDLDLSTFNGFNLVAVGVHRGIKWAVSRGPMSTEDYLQPNGYVELPKDHITKDLELSGEDYEVYEVHGGITLHGDNLIGFDTNHLGDYTPYLGAESGGHKWTLEEAAEEAKKLADQVADYHEPVARARHAQAEKLRQEANQLDPTTRKA